MRYIALIHKEKDSDYGVSFPDFPGCVSAGITIEQAKELAQEALINHIALLEELGQAIPLPSGLEKENKSATFFFIEVPSKSPFP